MEDSIGCGGDNITLAHKVEHGGSFGSPPHIGSSFVRTLQSRVVVFHRDHFVVLYRFGTMGRHYFARYGFLGSRHLRNCHSKLDNCIDSVVSMVFGASLFLFVMADGQADKREALG